LYLTFGVSADEWHITVWLAEQLNAYQIYIAYRLKHQTEGEIWRRIKYEWTWQFMSYRS